MKYTSNACTLILFALVLFGFAGVGSANELNKSATTSELKVALLDTGPIGDHGWTYEGHVSAAKMATKLSYVNLSERENAAGPNASQIMREYADNGYKLIFCHGGEFEDALNEVAPDYPDVIFLIEGNDGKLAANVGTYFVQTYETQYLMGAVAGNMTKTDKIAFVNTLPETEMVIDIDAFARGVASTNPKAKVYVGWIGSWYDPEKEKQIALSLINKGCDVITHTSDSDVVGETAEETGTYFLSYGSNMARFFPHVFLMGVVYNFEPAMMDIVESVHNGTWYSLSKQIRYYGLAEGGAQMAPFSDLVPDNVKALVREKQEEIVKGELAVFPGMSDEELWKTYYFEPNVVGELPKS
jgi:basic membrane protein A and related proteins